MATVLRRSFDQQRDPNFCCLSVSGLVSRREIVVVMVTRPGGRRCVRLVGDMVVVRAGARAYLGPRSGRQPVGDVRVDGVFPLG